MWVQGRESQHSTVSCPTLASRITEEDNRILVGEGLCEVVSKGWGAGGELRTKSNEFIPVKEDPQSPQLCPSEEESALKNWQAQSVNCPIGR